MAVTLEDIKNAAIAAGKSTADGNDGVMHFSKVIFMGAHAGVVTTKKGDTTLLDLYKVYLGEANKSKFGAKVDVSNDKALRFGKSKLAVFVHFARVKGGTKNWSLVQRAVAIINQRANSGDKVEKKVGSRHEQVLRVLRAQNKVPDKLFSDDQIHAALEPASDVADELMQALASIAAKAKKFAESDLAAKSGRSDYFARVQAEAEEQLALYRANHPATSAEDELDLDADGEDDGEPEAFLEAAE